MTTAQIISASKNEIRSIAISFARSNNYKVSEKYTEVRNELNKLMSDIHRDGKNGDYETAIKLSVALETLQTWN